MIRLTALLSLLVLFWTGTVSALPDDLDKIRLKDQHDTPFKVPSDIRYVVFAHDMGSKDLAEEWLSGKDPDFMKDNRIIYVVNISGMPRIISRMFAFPALRKKPYMILVDEVGQTTGDWPTQDSAVTLFTVTDHQIMEKVFIDDVEQMDEQVKLLNEEEAGTATESETSDTEDPTAE